MTTLLGPKPELKWIKITELYVDHEYQRNAKSKASRKNLAYMRENFSWAHCGALIVSWIAEKNQYAVVDGQHRLMTALARNDIPELPCVVISNQDLQRQAESFAVINSKRVTLTTLAKFHAAVAAGEDQAVAAKEIADECGLEIPSGPVPNSETDPRQLQCVGTLISLLANYSRKEIKWALTIILEAYGEQKGQMRANLIKALTEFIKARPDTERSRMVDVLRSVDPQELERDARSYMAIKGGTSKGAMTEALDRLYRFAGRGTQKATGASAPVARPSVPEKPYQPVPIERLQQDHNEYAGKRDSGQPLTDCDWPDIKRRLEKSPNRRKIATDYDVDLEELNFFIESCRRREQKSGEALAPSHRGA